jgi:hypothetical protein
MKRAALVLLLAGCATGRVPRVPGDPPPAVRDAEVEREYQLLLDRETSQAAVYDNLDSKLFFRAVWQSPGFVQARVRREALFKDMPADAQQARLEVEQARLAGKTEIFLAVHANDSKHEDFSRPNTMWRMVLVVDGREVLPVEIERLGRATTELRSYYSFMESFWIAYRVRFPQVDLKPGQEFEFRLSSALGRADLKFKAE